jgi:hypothetical protein
MPTLIAILPPEIERAALQSSARERQTKNVTLGHERRK